MVAETIAVVVDVTPKTLTLVAVVAALAVVATSSFHYYSFLAYVAETAVVAVAVQTQTAISKKEAKASFFRLKVLFYMVRHVVGIKR